MYGGTSYTHFIAIIFEYTTAWGISILYLFTVSAIAFALRWEQHLL